MPDANLTDRQKSGVFSKCNDGGKWKCSGSRGGFDAGDSTLLTTGARRTAPEGGRGPQSPSFLKIRPSAHSSPFADYFAHFPIPTKSKKLNPSPA